MIAILFYSIGNIQKPSASAYGHGRLVNYFWTECRAQGCAVMKNQWPTQSMLQQQPVRCPWVSALDAYLFLIWPIKKQTYSWLFPHGANSPNLYTKSWASTNGLVCIALGRYIQVLLVSSGMLSMTLLKKNRISPLRIIVQVSCNIWWFSIAQHSNDKPPDGKQDRKYTGRY